MRTFLKHHQYLIVGNSFSKNLGLYSERVGACTVVTQSKDEAEKVLSQLKIIVRSSYSSPPSHGGTILTTICQDPELYQAWQTELTQMRETVASDACFVCR